jgi:hypothetical protein
MQGQTHAVRVSSMQVANTCRSRFLNAGGEDVGRLHLAAYMAKMWVAKHILFTFCEYIWRKAFVLLAIPEKLAQKSTLKFVQSDENYFFEKIS